MNTSQKLPTCLNKKITQHDNNGLHPSTAHRDICFGVHHHQTKKEP